MVPVKMVLAVQDEYYIDPFLNYVRCSEFHQKVLVTAFSQKEAFQRFMESSGHLVQLILSESSFMDSDSVSQQHRVPWICLGEGDKGQGFVGKVSKYQPMYSLLSEVLDLYPGNVGRGKRGGGKCQVIGVYSVLGGSGKTTVALNIAKQLGMQGNRVFYLNLETVNAGFVSTGGDNETGQSSGLASLLYDLKGSDNEQFEGIPPVSNYAYRHLALQSDTFGPMENLNEMVEMEEQDTLQLINYIVDQGKYDIVVLDVDSSLNNRNKAVLHRADRLIWLLRDDWAGMNKTDLWLSYLKRWHPTMYNTIMSKVFFVMNRHSGEISSTMLNASITVGATLSNIPSWSQSGQEVSILHSPLFQRDVLRLCRELLFTEEDVSSFGGVTR
jgi:cellulose biosynthesis protein BcsQ